MVGIGEGFAGLTNICHFLITSGLLVGLGRLNRGEKLKIVNVWELFKISQS